MATNKTANSTVPKNENVPTKTNGMAIAGFVCALATICTGISAILGLIFSIVGLNQIKKTGEEGKGLAIAGIVISSIFMFIGIVALVIVAIIGVTIADKAVNNLDLNNLDINCDYHYEYVDGGYKSSYLCE